MGDKMDTYIKGRFFKIIYEGDRGYVVGLFKVIETNIDNLKNKINKTIIFTGYFHDLIKGDSYFFYGYETKHLKYGDQFNVTKYEKIKPESKDGLISFLSSELFHGVGPVLATSIVNTLGKESLDLILADVNNLNKVPKLSKKLADQIYHKLIQYEESHKIIVKLCDLSFSLPEALSIYNFYKNNTFYILEHNIYSIIEDVKSISFLKIDQIAQTYKLNQDAKVRIKAVIVYLIMTLTFENGDSYLEYDNLKNELELFLKEKLSEEKINEYFKELVLEKRIIIDDNKYYLFDLYEAETNIIKTIKYLNQKSKDNYEKITEKFEKLEKQDELEYNDLQKRAIIKALENNISIITGGPGTGKTTIIKAVVDLYKSLNKLNKTELDNQLALLAPTGRASKKISEATGYHAMTIHRFLKWNKEIDHFLVNEYNKNKQKLIIIDEVSMVDIVLFNNLLKGLTNGIKLVLVGDYHQLPSVSPGQLLKDLIESQKIETTKLELLYRQSEDSYIPMLANEIKKGEVSKKTFHKHSDYLFIGCYANEIIASLKKLVLFLIKKGYNYIDLQIMIPMYKGINGIDNINKELQKVINPPSDLKKEYQYGDVIFRVNDKVLQLVNVPDEGIYNGDIGIIIEINSHLGKSKTEISVDYDGNIVTYNSKTFIQIRHAFVISFHKAQGSEFPIVIIPMCSYYKRMLYRKLIYTGITRTKEKLYLLGDPNAFIYAIKNNDRETRKSDLVNKIVNNL